MTTVTPAPPETQPVPALPVWTDAQAVTSYLTSLAGIAVAVVAGLHPGFTEPAIVQSILPAIGTIVAGAAQVVNVVTHRSAHSSVAAAQAGNLVVHTPLPPPVTQNPPMSAHPGAAAAVSADVGLALTQAAQALQAAQEAVAAATPPS